jgi:ligand-binding sensor domain-containing protein
VTFHGAILARSSPLLVLALMIGCAADRGVERRSADPELLPFTYAPRSDGAFNGGVRAILQDRDGNIWIGTIGGGAWRYDGRELRQFTASDGLTTANVMAIHCDRDGTLWLGGTGVFRLTGQRFERVH